MRFIACGTAGGSMTAERAASGYLLQHDGHTIMLDCGPGSLQQAMRFGVSPAAIESVVLSHLHLDHALDLATYAYLLRYNSHWAAPSLYGPPGCQTFVERVAAFDVPNERPSPFNAITELDTSDEREILGFAVRSEETKHAPNLRAYARRFEAGGRSLVFSGDTASNPEMMARLAQGADVLVHECYTQQAMREYASVRAPELAERVFEAFRVGHCEVGDAARIARDAGVGRLVLTHLLATEDADTLVEQANAIFSGEVIVARDGLELDV